jgi:hypothetical protein
MTFAENNEKDALQLYSEGELTTGQACRALGLRDGAELLIALNDKGLPFPLPSPEAIEGQADLFVNLWEELSRSAPQPED